jgi:hypothetical protein
MVMILLQHSYQVYNLDNYTMALPTETGVTAQVRA